VPALQGAPLPPDALPSAQDVILAGRMWESAKEEVRRAGFSLATVEPFGELTKPAQSALSHLAFAARVALLSAPTSTLQAVPEGLVETARALLGIQPACHLCKQRVALWTPASTKGGNAHLYCDEHKPNERCVSVTHAGLYRALDAQLRAAASEPVAAPLAPEPLTRVLVSIPLRAAGCTKDIAEGHAGEGESAQRSPASGDQAAAPARA